MGIGESVEELFARAIQAGNYDPLRVLYEELMKADAHILLELLGNEIKRRNCYASFFERFHGCHFLTFNYDSLAEVFLFHRGAWYPHDGYGVPLEVDTLPGHSALRSRQSTSLVLHLHGSLCIYPRSSVLNRTT